jgi:hypothetical protein
MLSGAVAIPVACQQFCLVVNWIEYYYMRTACQNDGNMKCDFIQRFTAHIFDILDDSKRLAIWADRRDSRVQYSRALINYKTL